MKIIALNNHIKQHPNSISMFRGEGSTNEERLYKSNLPHDMQDNIVSTKKVYKNVKKTADLKSSGFFNVKNTPSFGAKPPVKPKDLSNFTKKLADNKMVHWFLKLAGKNPVVFEAFAALVVAGMLRPITILSLPAKKEDKEKNKKATAHSMASAVIGFVSTFLLMQPFVDGAKKLKEHPEKYGLDKNGKMFERLNFEINGVKKDPTRIKVYSDFIKYFPKVVFAPLIATSTIALIPVMDKYVLNKIVFKKNPAAQNAEMTPMDVYRSTSFKSNSNRHEKAFQSFAGGNV